MELNIISIISIIIAIISIVLAINNQKKFISKKGEELSLKERIKEYHDELKTSDNIIQKKSLEIEKLDKNIKKSLSLIKQKELELKHLLELESKESKLTSNVDRLKIQMNNLEENITSKTKEKEELNLHLDKLKNDVALYSPTVELIDLGHYEEPKYLYNTSERFKKEVSVIRDQLKTLITNKKAVNAPETIAIIEDVPSSKKAIQGQIRIMLKAFNIEADLLFNSLKPSNFTKTIERIDKIATDIEKSAISFKCGFSQNYIELKLKECTLLYQYRLKLEEEQEEQKAIKEQMREEQKAIREFERAILKAQKEEQMYHDALEKAKTELNVANDEEKDQLTNKIEMLELKLKEAMDNEGRAKSMAEQTRRGHVYIISNIGSFGEDIYKIGMTRRLEPLDRVKELGDASVPFLFDVHAMIFSEDAPKLEKELHKVFKNKRVNMINERKEFFNVSLDEIKDVVEESNVKVEFTKVAEASDYRETLVIRNSLLK